MSHTSPPPHVHNHPSIDIARHRGAFGTDEPALTHHRRSPEVPSLHEGPLGVVHPTGLDKCTHHRRRIRHQSTGPSTKQDWMPATGVCLRRMLLFHAALPGSIVS